MKGPTERDTSYTLDYWQGRLDAYQEMLTALKANPALPVQLMYDHIFDGIDRAEVAIEVIGEEMKSERSVGRL